MTITPQQCRAARALLDWLQPDLAKAAGIAPSTVARFERSARTSYPNTVETIRTALEAAGIIFIDGNNTVGPGVQLRDPEKK